MPESPAIEMHPGESEEKPAGIGEPGTALIGPAVANAVFAATGSACARFRYGWPRKSPMVRPTRAGMKQA